LWGKSEPLTEITGATTIRTLEVFAVDKIKKILNRETILYIVFGVATTVVNYIVFHLLYNVLWQQRSSLIANAAAFAAAVIFAFVVNKTFVFHQTFSY
jgi:putative flippase GtrA